MTTSIRTADYMTIYYDRSDPRNRGWAYNVVLDGDHTSDGLPHRRESVSLRTLLSSLRREWRTSGIAIPPASAWTQVDHDGPGYQWRA